MADTFFSLNVHCVFSTKNREPLLVDGIKERLWAFMGGIAQSTGDESPAYFRFVPPGHAGTTNAKNKSTIWYR